MCSRSVDEGTGTRRCKDSPAASSRAGSPAVQARAPTEPRSSLTSWPPSAPEHELGRVRRCPLPPGDRVPSLGVITRDTVEGPRPHRLTPSFVTLPLAAFSPFRGSSGSASRSSVGPSEASAPACVSDPPRSSGHSTSPIRLAWAVPLRCGPGLTPLRRVFTTSGVSRLRRGRDCPLTTVHRSLQTALDPPTFLLITNGEGIERGSGGSVCSSKCIYPRCDDFFFPREALKMPAKHRLTCHLSSISDVGLLGPCTKRGVRVGCTPCLEGAGRG